MGKEGFTIKDPVTIDESNMEFWVRFFKLGYDFEKSEYPNNLSFRNALKNLVQIKMPTNDGYKLETYSLSRIVNEAKSLSKYIFNGVDMKVPVFIYEFNENENRGLIQMYNKINALAEMDLINEEQYIKSATDYFIENTTRKSAFNIPIEQVDFNTSSGLIEGKVLEGPCMVSAQSLEGIKEFVKRVGPLNERIYLGKKANSLTVGTYVHEIVHCLLDRNKGIVENYFYDEFLSEFMEKVAIDLNDHSANKKSLKMAEIIRVEDMQASVKDLLFGTASIEEKYDSIKYIQSGILAGLLFDKYEKADKEGKEKILSEVKDVLNGKQKVQSIIDAENLSIDDSKIYFDKIKGYIEELNKSKDGQNER